MAVARWRPCAIGTWYPLYVFVRRRGYAPEDAQDLTQAFFARLLEKGDVARASPARGRFRSFLLASLQNFLLNEFDRMRTLKRGGGVRIFLDRCRRSGAAVRRRAGHDGHARRTLQSTMGAHAARSGAAADEARISTRRKIRAVHAARRPDDHGGLRRLASRGSRRSRHDRRGRQSRGAPDAQALPRCLEKPDRPDRRPGRPRRRNRLPHPRGGSTFQLAVRPGVLRSVTISTVCFIHLQGLGATSADRFMTGADMTFTRPHIPFRELSAVAIVVAFLMASPAPPRRSSIPRWSYSATACRTPGNAFALRGAASTPPDYGLDPFLVPAAPYARGGHHFQDGASWVEQLARSLRVSASARPAFQSSGWPPATLPSVAPAPARTGST